MIIQFTENKSIPAWRGYLIALAMLAVAFVQSILLHQYFHIAFTTGMRLRTCVLGLVYKKVKFLSFISENDTKQMIYEYYRFIIKIGYDPCINYSLDNFA